MRKKGILTVLAVFAMSLTLQLGVCASDTLSITKVTCANGNITVKGNAAADEFVTLKMTVTGSEERDYTALFALKETVAAATGNFEISFSIPDEKDGVSTEGDYTIAVASGGEKKEQEFYYPSKTAREEAIAKINGAADETALAAVLKEENPEVLKSVGMNPEFDKNGTAVIEELARLLYENEDIAAIDQSGLLSATEMYMQYALINTADAAAVKSAVAELNPDCGDNAFGELEEAEKNFVADYIYSHKKYDNPEAFELDCNKAAALYDINLAKYTELEDLIRDSAVTLDISGESEYNNYMALSEKDILEVSKLVVLELKSSPTKNIESLLNCIAEKTDEYKAAKNKESSKNNGGGGGGGGRTGNSYSLPVIKPATTPAPTPEKLPEFNDVNESHWANEYIGKLAQKNIISGYTDGSFKPSATVTREEFVKLIVAAKGIYDKNAECDFEDVNGSAWYASYIGSAVKNGLVNGVSENAFGVGTPITREAAAVIIARAIDAAGGDISAVADGDSVSGYAKDSVAALSSMGIINGNTNGEFMPKNYITRAETAKMIYFAFGGNK